MNFRGLLLSAAVVALPALDARALGLGTARGAVFIGRPLQVIIPATFETGDPDPPCVDAEVFQGDSRVDARRVTTLWEPGPDGRGAVRVLADAAVEEPVVIVYLRVGCTNRMTRRYVLLAEQPAEADSATQARPVAPRLRQAPGEAAPRTSPPAGAVGPQRAPVVAAPVPAARAKPAARETQPPRARTAIAQPKQAPRLKLEPLDLGEEREPVLKTSSRLQAQPAADAAGRQQAAALWRAVRAGPEEALRNDERMQALERDMRALHELARKNATALDLMGAQLEQARSERNVVTQMALLLALLLALALAAALWLWRSGRQGAATDLWWRGRQAPPETEFPSQLHAEEPAGAAASQGAGRAPDIDLSRPAPATGSMPLASSGAAAPRFVGSRWPHSDFYSGHSGTSRLKAEEMNDVQQQAEFFVSIGQPDRAIALLEGHLHQQADTSAVAWLDLLEIYHLQGRREDYERVRAAFTARFDAPVPPFDAYGKQRASPELPAQAAPASSAVDIDLEGLDAAAAELAASGTPPEPTPPLAPAPAPTSARAPLLDFSSLDWRSLR